MSDVFVTAFTQWGMAGVALIAAGYIIWNNHKEAQKTKRHYEEKLEELSKRGTMKQSVSGLKDEIVALGEKIDDISCAQGQCHGKLVEMDERIVKIEKTVHMKNEERVHQEAQRLMNITKITPTIHTVIQNNMDEMKADHVFVALLHNGTQSLTGIPFVKMDVIVEKYNPLDNLNDYDYASIYKDEEITRHDKLPQAILQNEYLDIVVNEDGYSHMDSLDMISAREMRKIGTKRIIFECIRDARGMAMGFVCAYSYKTKDMDLELFRETAQTLERLYRDVCYI